MELSALKINAGAGDPNALYELGKWCLSKSPENDIEEGKYLLTRAALKNDIDAQILLGDILIKNLCAPVQTYEAGANWYKKAVEHGSSKAQSRLGVLYLYGLGVSQDDPEAFNCFKRAAKNGGPQAKCDLAYLYSNGVGIERDETEATNWYLKAASEGEPRAFYNLGLRYAQGIGVQQNLVHACAFLEYASYSSYPGSKTTINNLLLALSDEQIKEKAILSNNLVEILEQQSDLSFLTRAENKHSGNDSWDTVDMIDDTEPNALSRVEVISWHPRIMKIHDFLQQHESDHLIDIAIRHRSESESLVDENTGKSLGTSFSGHTTLLDMSLYDPVTCLIDRRIAEATRVPVDYGEWLSILGYAEAQSYAPHVDYFITDQKTGERIHEHVGQRLITFLMYLNDVEEGGETVYQDAGISVTPEKGVAIMHYNCLPDGSVDPLTLHTSRPVTKGVKWLARKAICERSLYKGNK